MKLEPGETILETRRDMVKPIISIISIFLLIHTTLHKYTLFLLIHKYLYYMMVYLPYMTVRFVVYNPQ